MICHLIGHSSPLRHIAHPVRPPTAPTRGTKKRTRHRTGTLILHQNAQAPGVELVLARQLCAAGNQRSVTIKLLQGLMWWPTLKRQDRGRLDQRATYRKYGKAGPLLGKVGGRELVEFEQEGLPVPPRYRLQFLLGRGEAFLGQERVFSRTAKVIDRSGSGLAREVCCEVDEVYSELKWDCGWEVSASCAGGIDQDCVGIAPGSAGTGPGCAGIVQGCGWTLRWTAVSGRASSSVGAGSGWTRDREESRSIGCWTRHPHQCTRTLEAEI